LFCNKRQIKEKREKEGKEKKRNRTRNNRIDGVMICLENLDMSGISLFTAVGKKSGKIVNNCQKKIVSKN